MELLSPAGDRESLVAAVQCGADAVYFGTRGFNARRSADNFAGDGLLEAVSYCHLRGVRVYVTLNTIVRQNEYSELTRTIEEIYMSGADAFIVQDLGVAQAAKVIAPEMELHASTQMAVHNRQGVEFLAERNFTRVVLAREMELPEIEKCAGMGVKLETFAHGALCVSCSGQCLMSSMIGGRSGNRGMCAQPCRMKYDMDGHSGYLLSTRDLKTIGFLEDFRRAGVDSLKIEGRLKRPEYVAVVTGIYRKALDGAEITAADAESLAQIFNRGGFTRGYAHGVCESDFMSHDKPNNAGFIVGGCVISGFLNLERDIEPGDTLALRGIDGETPVKLSGEKDERVSCTAARRGDVLVRLISEAQMRAARESFSGENRAARLTASVKLKVGEPSVIEVSGGGQNARYEGCIVQRAQRAPFDPERALAQLRKTGGTPFVIDNIALNADADAFVSMSELNGLRRAVLDKLTADKCAVDRTPGKFNANNTTLVRNAARLSVCARNCEMQLSRKGDSVLKDTADSSSDIMDMLAGHDTQCIFGIQTRPVLRAQSGDIEALRIAVSNGADEAVFAPVDMRKLDIALYLDKFYLAVPQVMREDELDTLNSWANKHKDKILGVYLSNVAQLDMEWPGITIADYGLNIASQPALSAVGCGAYCPSVELTARQIDDIGGKPELIVYGYLPVMQLRHCPRRAAEGMPGSHSACRFCDAAGAAPLPALSDRTGARFALRRIAYGSGCVIQILNSVPFLLIKRADKLPKSSAWRILVDKSDAGWAARVHRAYLDFGSIPEVNDMKYTTGHFFRGVD